MPRLGVEGHGEGEEGGSRRGAQFPDRLVGVRVEASAFVGRDGWVFDPESEAAIGAHGGDEVGVQLGVEPLDLVDFGIVSSPRIAENPITGIILIVDFDLAVNGAGCKAIAVVVESGCCDHISVAMAEELESVGQVVQWVIVFFLC